MVAIVRKVTSNAKDRRRSRSVLPMWATFIVCLLCLRLMRLFHPTLSFLVS